MGKHLLFKKIITSEVVEFKSIIGYLSTYYWIDMIKTPLISRKNQTNCLLFENITQITLSHRIYKHL